MNKKSIILTIATLLSFSGIASAEYVIQFNNSQSKGMIPAASSQPANSSCKDILDNGESIGSGVYSITVNDKEFDVYCDMTSVGGGWTMVVAQFEADPVTNWDEGIQSDYDPSLASKNGFALNGSQLPLHSEVALGKDLDPVFLEYFDFTYNTGNISVTQLLGKKTGNAYQFHRNTGNHYGNHDPEHTLYYGSAGWSNTLTVDRVGGSFFSWAFAPMNTSQSSRGYAMNEGQAMSSGLNTYGWTVWVR